MYVHVCVYSLLSPSLESISTHPLYQQCHHCPTVLSPITSHLQHPTPLSPPPTPTTLFLPLSTPRCPGSTGLYDRRSGRNGGPGSDRRREWYGTPCSVRERTTPAAVRHGQWGSGAAGGAQGSRTAGMRSALRCSMCEVLCVKGCKVTVYEG
jgi:hypothetical protein